MTELNILTVEMILLLLTRLSLLTRVYRPKRITTVLGLKTVFQLQLIYIVEPGVVQTKQITTAEELQTVSLNNPTTIAIRDKLIIVFLLNRMHSV